MIDVLRQLEVASLRNLNRAQKSVGQFASEYSPHLLGRTNIKIRARVTQTICIGHCLSRTDTKQDVMCARVFGRQVVSVVSGDKRHACPARKLHQGLTNSLLCIKSVLLDLEEVISLPHDLLKFNCSCRGVVTVFASQ